MFARPATASRSPRRPLLPPFRPPSSASSSRAPRRPFQLPAWFALRGELEALGAVYGDEALGAALEDLGFDPLAYADQKRAELLAAVDARVAQVQAGIQAAASGAYGTAKGLLADARDGLWSTYYGAIQTGANAAGDAVRTLAQRAGDAWAALGQGAGAAFRSFWGLSPAEGLGDLVTIGAVLLVAFGAGAVYLWSTPGGQAYLSSLGGGVGRAIGEMGAGYGGAARELGHGAGSALGRFDLGKMLGAVL